MVETKVIDCKPPDEYDSPGSYHMRTIGFAGVPIATHDELRRQMGIRFIEEAVELALATGVTPADVLLHVTDALHSECKKAKVYPSQFDVLHVARRDVVLVEIVDVEICADCIRETARISRKEIEEHKKTKLELLRLRVRDGNFQVVDGYRIYKKDR